MNKVGKKHIDAKKKLVEADVSTLQKALDFIIKNAHAKFDESIEASVVLGIDPSKGEQVVRGSAMLPNGTGKKVRVLVFAKGAHVDAAKKAGADYVGLEEYIEKIEQGWLDFDVSVATPDLMGTISKVAKILGPKGMLPNVKVGTVTFDVASIVSDLKQGRVSFRNDKGGVLHAPFGKLSFGVEKLKVNLASLLKALQASKPASSKGKFLRKIVISSTMGVGIQINADEAI